MAWENTQDARAKLARQMSSISEQFETAYGKDVVAAVLVAAKERGEIPSDAMEFGELLNGVSAIPQQIEKAPAEVKELDTTERDYLAEAAAKDPAARAYMDSLVEARKIVSEEDLSNARLQKRMQWVHQTLSDRANAAANGVIFSDPEIDPENPPRTLDEWIEMSQPTGEVIEGDFVYPDAQARVMAAE